MIVLVYYTEALGCSIVSPAPGIEITPDLAPPGAAYAIVESSTLPPIELQSSWKIQGGVVVIDPAKLASKAGPLVDYANRKQNNLFTDTAVWSINVAQEGHPIHAVTTSLGRDGTMSDRKSVV